MNISDWLRHAKSVLTETGCPDPEIDARWMAEDVLGMTRVDLKFEGEREVTPDQLGRLNGMLSRRAAGEPKRPTAPRRSVNCRSSIKKSFP